MRRILEAMGTDHRGGGRGAGALDGGRIDLALIRQAEHRVRKANRIAGR